MTRDKLQAFETARRAVMKAKPYDSVKYDAANRDYHNALVLHAFWCTLAAGDILTIPRISQNVLDSLHRSAVTAAIARLCEAGLIGACAQVGYYFAHTEKEAARKSYNEYRVSIGLTEVKY